MAGQSERLKRAFEQHGAGNTPGLPGLNIGRRDRDVLAEIAVEQIHPDPNQPRKDLGDLTELKLSISQVGIIQPILVTIVGEDRFQLIAGERRFTAAKELGLAKVPAIVRTIEEHRLLEVQIIENVQRKDLNPVEEAFSYRRLMDEFGLTQEDVAERVGKSKSSINEILRILTLPEEVLAEVRTSEPVNKSVLLEIAKQPTEAERLYLWEAAKAGMLTVKRARQNKLLGEPSPAPLSNAKRIVTPLCTITFRFNEPGVTNAKLISELKQVIKSLRNEESK